MQTARPASSAGKIPSVCTASNAWQGFYSDRGFSGGRWRLENFPPPGIAPLTKPIGIVTWWGWHALPDNATGDCLKDPPIFTIRFYEYSDPNTSSVPKGFPNTDGQFLKEFTVTAIRTDAAAMAGAAVQVCRCLSRWR